MYFQWAYVDFFSIITPVFSVKCIIYAAFDTALECIIILICWFAAAQETFLIIISVEDSCAATVLGLFDEYRVKKNCIYLYKTCISKKSLL